jgi:proteasome lid subunit RPN8/RPN11
MPDPHKHPWILGALEITKDVLERVAGEARDAYARDEESCGLLVGPGDRAARVDEIVPLVNRANALHAMDPEAYPRTGRTAFEVDPLRFAREVATRAAAARPAKVLYHSHLDVGAYFSETDAAAATAGGPEPTYELAYLVTSVVAGEVREHALFVWDPGARAFVRSSFEVIGST